MNNLKLVFLLLLLSFPLYSGELLWVGEEGYKDDGVEPEIGFGGGKFLFKIAYYEPTGVLPKEVWVVVDTNRDGFLSETEKFPMATVIKVGDRYIYEKEIELSYKAGSKNDFTYFFAAKFPAKVLTTPLRNGPILKQRISFSLSNTYWDLGKNFGPGAVVTMRPDDRIFIMNTGDGAEAFALEIEKEDNWPEGWRHSPKADGADANTYVLSAIFAPETELYITEKDFNRAGNEDVVTTKTKRADGPVFAANLSNPAEYLKPNQKTALWLQLKLPTTSFGKYALEPHNITLKLTCLGVE